MRWQITTLGAHHGTVKHNGYENIRDQFRWKLGFGSPVLACSVIHSAGETLRFRRQHPNPSVLLLRPERVLGLPARNARKE